MTRKRKVGHGPTKTAVSTTEKQLDKGHNQEEHKSATDSPKEADMNGNVTSKSPDAPESDSSALPSTRAPIQKAIRKPRVRAQIPVKSPRVTRSRTAIAIKASAGDLVSDPVVVIDKTSVPDSARNEDKENPVEGNLANNNPSKPHEQADVQVLATTTKENRGDGNTVNNQSLLSREGEDAFVLAPTYTPQIPSGLSNSPEVEEIPVPPGGAVYEKGFVWENSPLPKPNGTPSKGILKSSGNERLHLDQRSEQDRELDSPIPVAAKKSRGCISFSQDPHHVRYFHSPATARKLRKKSGMLPKISRRRLQQKEKRSLTPIPQPWNPTNAMISLPQRESEPGASSNSATEIRFSKENEDVKTEDSAAPFQFGGGFSYTNQPQPATVDTDPAAGDTQGFDPPCSSIEEASASALLDKDNEVANTSVTGCPPSMNTLSESSEEDRIDKLIREVQELSADGVSKFLFRLFRTGFDAKQP